MWDADIKHFMKIWMEDDDATQIAALVNGQEFVMFFEKEKSIYGVTEDGRLTFARMKNPDEEVSDDWAKEATFMAINLTKALSGDKVHNIFSQADIKKIKVIDEKEAERKLLEQAKNKKVKAGEIEPKEPNNQSMGTIQLKDKDSN